MITQKMIDQHSRKALDEGGIIAPDLKIVERPAQQTNYQNIQALDYDNPENQAFYSAAYVLMDGEERKIVQNEKRRIGGFNLYPIGYNSRSVNIKPRVFSGKYRMGFCNFELSASMLGYSTSKKLSSIYQEIRKDVESEVVYNTEDSTMVLHRTAWEPPHFHVQNREIQNDIDCISYAVKIFDKGPHTSVFDFLSAKLPISVSKENPVTKIYFKGKYIHQVYKTLLEDENMYYFFVWDGCQFKNKINLENEVHVQRWFNKI